MYRYKITELLEKLRNDEISAYMLCAYYVGRIKKIGLKDKLNAVIAFNPDWEKEAKELDQNGNKDLPLYGIPYLVKDNIDLLGLPTTAGSLALLDNFPNEDSWIVDRLKELGAICLGKTNMSELANFLTQGMVNGYSSYGGQVLNAYNQNANVSGSSSGSAVAVSCGLVPFSIGTDTSFSIVGCANVNGVFGYKPALGTANNQGVLPISKHLDEVGVLTKKFDDLLVVVNALFDLKAFELKKPNIVMSNYQIENVSKEQLERYYKVFPNIKHIDTPSTLNLLELMKRDFSVSLNEYLKNHNSKIKNIRQLYDAYLANPERMMKFGASRLHESLLREKDSNNIIEINKLVFEQKELHKQFEKTISDYHGVVMSGADQSFHFANLASIAIPLMIEKDGLPRGLIMYGLNEEELLGAAKKVVESIKEIDYPSIVKLIDDIL